MTQIGRSNSGHTVTVPRRPDLQVTLSWAAVTNVGRKRSVNEDSFLAQSPVFAVADGMGGHSAGDVASAAVVTRLAEVIETDFIDPDVVEHALGTAAQDIARVSGTHALGTGTTVTGAALTLVGTDPYWAVFNIGDSRVYQLRGRLFEQVTVDHSVVQELVDSGVISKEQAAEQGGKDLERMSWERLLPRVEILEKVARYEAHLSRGLYKALHELEALQNRRLGGSAPLARLDVEGLTER